MAPWHKYMALECCDITKFLFIAHLTFPSSKTPGGRLVYLYVKKRGTAPKCGDCGSKMNGVSS